MMNNRSKKKSNLPESFADLPEVRSKFVRDAILEQESKIREFPAMPRLPIVCGTKSGLPFECLMTDVISGCLPINKICYGNCTSAGFWYKQGYDFGKRSLNEFDPVRFRESALALSPEQKWLRQGWASDCSFSKQSWTIVVESANILAELGISMVILTKLFALPTREMLEQLVQAGTEIRVSISALDSDQELARRLSFLQTFRDLGGKAVPYVISSRFSQPALATNQEAILNWIVEHDFIAGENPLRLNSDNQARQFLKTDGFWHPKFPDEYWFGRVCHRIPNFLLPPPTHLGPAYTLPFRFASKAIAQEIPGLEGNLPTFEKLQAGYESPSQNLFKHATYSMDKNLYLSETGG